jgi:hypothetical protein
MQKSTYNGVIEPRRHMQVHHCRIDKFTINEVQSPKRRHDELSQTDKKNYLLNYVTSSRLCLR